MGQFVINNLKDYKIAYWIVTLGPKQVVSWDWKPRVEPEVTSLSENPVLWYMDHDQFIWPMINTVIAVQILKQGTKSGIQHNNFYTAYQIN